MHSDFFSKRIPPSMHANEQKPRQLVQSLQLLGPDHVGCGIFEILPETNSKSSKKGLFFLVRNASTPTLDFQVKYIAWKNWGVY